MHYGKRLAPLLANRFGIPKGSPLAVQSFLEPLANLLNGILRTSEKSELWASIAKHAALALDGARCKVQTGLISPDKKHLAVCVEVKTWAGLKTRYAGFVYSIKDTSIVGRVALGKRESSGWVEN
jgi:hypothetical protein